MMEMTRMTSVVIKVLDRVDGRKTMREVALCMMMMMMMMIVVMLTITISYVLEYVAALAWIGLGGERIDPEEGEVIVSNDCFGGTLYIKISAVGGTF